MFLHWLPQFQIFQKLGKTGFCTYHLLERLIQWYVVVMINARCQMKARELGCVYTYFAKAESAFWNADSTRRSKTPLIQAIMFELKWTGKAFIWRHLNVVICDFAFMLPPESAFCSNHDRKRTFLGCVYTYFAKAFWNADSKRRSKTLFTGVLFMLPSRRNDFVSMHCACVHYVYRRRHVSEFSECLIQAIVRAQVNRKGVYMTSFKRGYNGWYSRRVTNFSQWLTLEF